MFKFLDQKGQALLIVVLVMVVALTVGLAVVARSIVNLKNSQQEVGSQQALSAAEAGVEQAIKSGISVSDGTFSTSTKYETAIKTVSGDADFLLNGNNKVSQDDAMYIWLTPYSTNQSELFRDADAWSGNLTIYWGDDANACNAAALEIAVVWNTEANPKVTRYIYDPCPARVLKNHFTIATPVNKSISGITLLNSNNTTTPIHVTNGFLVRVVPLYADSYIGVSSINDVQNKSLPTQGSIITSTGTTGSNVQRKLDVFQGYPEIPAELFPFSLFWP
jgi:Tfp pilus assembly protein PilV